jgi:prolyl-tRNA synthetase
MKDFYSFHANEDDLDAYYEKMKKAYEKIYKTVGIEQKTYLTFASGGSFSKYSHEFQTATEAGEDTIYLCEKCNIAINKEVTREQKVCPECESHILKEIKSIEVGNIFKLKTKFSEPFNLTFADKNDEQKLVIMGTYGIGLPRLMGTVVEINHDEKGIVWPKSIAPFQIHLISIGSDNDKTSEKIYNELTLHGWEVLWDDRNESVGMKFNDADLIGIPVRLVVSNNLTQQKSVEIKLRIQKEAKIIKSDSLEQNLKQIF